VTHADFEKLLGLTLSASTVPTDTLIDSLCELIEGMADAYLISQAYTLAQANSASSAGLKAILLEGVRWRLDEWYRWTQAGGAQTATDQDGSITYEKSFDLPRSIKSALLGLVSPRPTIDTVDMI
jgi:hypothetical protein